MPEKVYFPRPSEKNTLSMLQGWVYSYRWAVMFASFGLIFLLGALFSLNSGIFEGEKVEVLGTEVEAQTDGNVENTITVEIAGQIQKPGVYTLKMSDRVEQLLVASGGLSASADREWVEKNINRASKLADGQKVYIPRKGENVGNLVVSKTSSTIQTKQGTLVNINTSSLKELDSLTGIGATRAQAIIDNRPYSSSDELVSKKVIPKSVFDKIKDQITL